MAVRRPGATLCLGAPALPLRAAIRPGRLLNLSRAGRLQVGLRTTILVLLVGLLIGTVAAIAAVTFLSTRQATGELEALHFELASTAATREVELLLEPAQSILAEFRTEASRGLLPVDRPDELGDLLAERLRHRPNLAWLSYSDAATGRFVGAWRRADGAIVLNRSSPDVDAGRPSEAVVAIDGTRTPLTRDLKSAYDPRQRPWYAAAARAADIVWAEPYEFNEGEMGITAALALREAATGALRGVFTADFFLGAVSDYLAEMLGTGRVRAFVLSRDGRLIASSEGQQEAATGLLAAALPSLPRGLDALGVGEPQPFTFEHGGARYAAAARVFPVAGELEWVTVVIAPEEAFVGVIYDNARFAAAIGLLVLLVAVALGSILAARVAAPLSAIALDLERVGRFELAREPVAHSFVREIGTVTSAVERTKSSLRSFGRYVPTELVRELLATGEEAQLGGRVRSLTIQFSDLDGFTSFAERMSPRALVSHLAEYLGEMTEVLAAHRGTVAQFLGDGILAFFNAPSDVPDHAARACRAALQQQARLRSLRGKWGAEGRPLLNARIGLHLGDALVGNIGTAERFEYTAIGDAVNLASRLEGLNKVYGTRILASREVREAAGAGFEWRTLDRVAVAGRQRGTLVCELLGERGHVDPATLAARDLYEQALRAYFDRRFAEAADGFRAVELTRSDRAAEIMRLRAEALLREAPAPEWDGVHLQLSK